MVFHGVVVVVVLTGQTIDGKMSKQNRNFLYWLLPLEANTRKHKSIKKHKDSSSSVRGTKEDESGQVKLKQEHQ